MVEYSRYGLDETSALAWLAYSVGRKRTRTLLRDEGSAVAAVARIRPPSGDLARFVESIGQGRHRLIAVDDPIFPPLLREIPDPPLVLYAAGDPCHLCEPALAVVGARRCSRSGSVLAVAFGRDLAAIGFTIVSGLAFGIDAAAHRGAMQTGRTVAVLGAGLGRIYPATHRALADAVLDSGGVLLSEYPADQSARPYHFPERNRLISGLSLAVLVVEASEQSGSLITARFALEQGREVMAVPGSINNPVARGCHILLRQGAVLVETIADVVESLGFAPRGLSPPDAPTDPTPVRAELADLLRLVGIDATTFDELCAGSDVSPELTAARLIELELGGFVERIPGGYIRRAL